MLFRLVVIGLLLSPSLWAEDSAQLHIGMRVPQLVQITEVQDVDLGQWSGSGEMQSEQQVCVWSSTGEYSLNSRSENAELGQFRLVSESAKAVGYQVYWDDGVGYRQLESGQALAGLMAAQQRSCAGEDARRSALRVVVPEEVLANAEPGAYRDLLQLTVVAE